MPKFHCSNTQPPKRKWTRAPSPTNSRKQQRNRGNPRDSRRNDRKSKKGRPLFPKEKRPALTEKRSSPTSCSSQPIPKNWKKEVSRPAKVNDVAFPPQNPHDIPELVPAETEAPAGSAPGTPTGHLKRVGSAADRYRNSLRNQPFSPKGKQLLSKFARHQTAFLTKSHRFTSGEFPLSPPALPNSRRRTFTKEKKVRKIGFQPSSSHFPEGKSEMNGLFHSTPASEEARTTRNGKPAKPFSAEWSFSRRKKTAH
jgi:hypothetical protein